MALRETFFIIKVLVCSKNQRRICRNDSEWYSSEFGLYAEFNWTLIMIIKANKSNFRFLCLGWNRNSSLYKHLAESSFHFSQKDQNDRNEFDYRCIKAIRRKIVMVTGEMKEKRVEAWTSLLFLIQSRENSLSSFTNWLGWNYYLLIHRLTWIETNVRKTFQPRSSLLKQRKTKSVAHQNDINWIRKRNNISFIYLHSMFIIIETWKPISSSAHQYFHSRWVPYDSNRLEMHRIDMLFFFLSFSVSVEKS